MKMNSMKALIWIAVVALVVTLAVAPPTPARALRVQDVTRLKGDMPNQLVGMGLVFGLTGTGDGGDFLPAMRPLQQMLGKFSNPVAITKELKNANNVALVALSVSVPPAGAREGDKLDVKVTALAAKSLAGGRLFLCPIQGPLANTKIYALAEGSLAIDDDKTPTVATIKGGAVITEDIVNESIVNGKFTLVLSPTAATYATANAIADQINEEVSTQTDNHVIANALDATTVDVLVPTAETAKPAAFIARIQALQIPALPGAAKVLINSKTGTIVFSGDVELSPTIITHNGLTIAVSATPNGSTTQPAAAAGSVDPSKQRAASLRELVDAFNLMRVAAKDRITIIKQLYDSGSLHCQLEGE